MDEPLPRHVSSAILMAATIAFGIGNVVVPEAISQPYFLSGTLALVVGTIACAIDGWRYANRLLRERAGSDPGRT